jgi:ribosomal protein S18 acetylase RimI-like enzyme
VAVSVDLPLGELSDRTIRSATEQDVEAVLCLWDAAGAPPSVTDTREGLPWLLASDGDALLVAEDEGTLVGSLIAGWDGWRGSFYRLAVHPDWRRRGIATVLLREGESRLRARRSQVHGDRLRR